MAARILADAVKAPILTIEILHGVVEAASTVTEWVRRAEYREEVILTGNLALRNLRLIEARAKAQESTYVEDRFIVDIHNYAILLRQAVRSKVAPEPEDSEGSDLLRMSEALCNEGKNNSTGSSSGQNAAAMETVNMEEDAYRCSVLAAKHTCVLWFSLVCLTVIGIVVLIELDKARTKTEIDGFQMKVTEELARVASSGLEMMYDAAVKQNMYPEQEMVSTFLTQMTSSAGGSNVYQMYRDGAEHFAEFRGAVQNFEDNGAVTNVTTPPVFGVICQKNVSVYIKEDNDVFSDEKVVLLRFAPYQCANDAGSNGIFRLVIPSFFRTIENAETYRRTHARVASFYSTGFGVSVAVTYDRDTIQEVSTPRSTLYGKISTEFSAQGDATVLLTMWSTLIAFFVVELVLSILVCALHTSFPFHHLLFSVLIGFSIMGGLSIVMVVTQIVNSGCLNELMEVGTKAEVEAVSAALLTTGIRQFSLSDALLLYLESNVFPGQLAATDGLLTNVIPSSMRDQIIKVNGETIVSNRRGQYSNIVHGYAVGSTYLYSVDEVVFLVQELPPSTEVNTDIVVVLTVGIAAGLFTAAYLQWSPLFRLRQYVIRLDLMRRFISFQSWKITMYFIIILGSLAGAAGAAAYGNWTFRRFTTDFAQETLVLLGACLRAPSIVDVCTNACGMPDFVAVLYFLQREHSTNTNEGIEVLPNSMPLPFPVEVDWATRYIGAFLALNSIQTTLMNIASFATPLVNSSWGGVTPRYVLRTMLSTSNVNESVGFSMERFPSSFGSFMYAFKTYSIGITIMLGTAFLVCAALEWLHLYIHKRHRNGRRVYGWRVVMICVIGLLFLGFLLFALVSIIPLKQEVEFFTFHELQFLVNAVGYRLSIQALMKKYSTQADLITVLEASVQSVSLNAMRYGRQFFRVCLAKEVGAHGSGIVTVYGAEWTEPIQLGSEDTHELTLCGRQDARAFSTATGNVLYCYQTIPQPFDDTSTNARLFVVGILSSEAWEDEVVHRIRPKFVGLTILIGFVVFMLSLGIHSVVMRIASNSDYPLITNATAIKYSTETLPSQFAVEHYITPQERTCWLMSFVFLGLVAMYITISTVFYVDMLVEADKISLVFQSQSDVFDTLSNEVQIYSLDYTIYPYTEYTLDKLVDMVQEAQAGTSSYVFVTESGLNSFSSGVTAFYESSLGSDKKYLKQLLLSSTMGYGSFASVISVQYASMVMARQTAVLQNFQSLRASLLTSSTENTITDYGGAMKVLHTIAVANDLLMKLFVLDHLVVNSIASLSSPGGDTWPFPTDDQQAIITVSQTAAADLILRIDSTVLLAEEALQTVSKAKYPQQLLETIRISFPSAIAIESFVNAFWAFQTERQEELSVLSNSTKLNIAFEGKKEELAFLLAQYPTIVRAKEEELSARQTRQLGEYLLSGEPIENEFTQLAWQRSQDETHVSSVYIVLVVCSMLMYFFTSGMILCIFALLRKQAEMVQQEVFEKKYFPPVFFRDVGAPFYTNQENPKGEDGSQALSSKKEVVSEGKMETPTDKSAGEGVIDWHDPLKNSITVEELEKRTREEVIPPSKRKRLPVLLWVFIFLLLPLVPLIASFLLMSNIREITKEHESSLAGLLAVQPQILYVTQQADEFLLHLNQYYTDSATLQDTFAFLANLDLCVEQLIWEFIWEAESSDLSLLQQVQEKINDLTALVLEEITVFRSITTDVDTYYDVQSRFARTLLPTLTSDNSYESLIPVSMTTEGSALYTFSEDAYKTAVTRGKVATVAEVFVADFQNYNSVLTELLQVSQAELQMWDDVIVGGSAGGGTRAAAYPTFNTLVGENALPVLRSSTEASASDAEEEIATYFKPVLDNAGTKDAVEKLFSTTLTPPTASSPPKSSDAFFAAAYTSSYLGSTTTITDFTALFAYNRNFVSFSTTHDGSPTLVDTADTIRSYLLRILDSIDESRSVHIQRATRNTWIWDTEVVGSSGTRIGGSVDVDSHVLGVKWCFIIFFWLIVAAASVGAYIIFFAMIE